MRVCDEERGGMRGEGGGGGGRARKGSQGKRKAEHSGAYCHMILVISDETSTNGTFEPTYMSFSEKLSGKCEDANHRVVALQHVKHLKTVLKQIFIRVKSPNTPNRTSLHL